MKRNSSDVLVTFTGFHDPYAMGLIDGEEQPGPILTLAGARKFGRIVLFSTPRTEENTESTRQALLSQHDTLIVETRALPLDDPTDYQAITTLLINHMKDIQETLPNHTFFISVASGTPQMHACWVMLLRDNIFQARILHVRPPRFVTADSPLVTEIDLAKSLVVPERSGIRSAAGAPDKYPLVQQASHETVDKEAPHEQLETARRQLNIVGEHSKMREVLERIEVAAPTDVNVLILGETGTGKELLARLLHELSDRSNAPFVPLNCGAISRELIESTLFGHAKGAFTGATHDHAGKFMEADGGTLFLDELCELLPETQVKLLRVIEDGVIQPIGATSTRTVDVRIIAATNKNLQHAIREGRFREDLFYRLNTVQVRIPPLRERASDIPAIALHLLEHINLRLRRPKRLSREALKHLMKHTWQGNVRELRNVLTQSVMFCAGNIIEDGHIVFADNAAISNINTIPEPEAGFNVNKYLQGIRKHLFLRAVNLSGGNKSQAARLLGVSAQAVHKFINELND